MIKEQSEKDGGNIFGKQYGGDTTEIQKNIGHNNLA